MKRFALLLATIAFAGAAFAQYPNKPIKMIVPYPCLLYTSPSPRD